MAENVERLIEDYRKSKITRREFIHRALVLTGSLAVATTLGDAVTPTTSHANLVDPNDPGLASSEIKFNSTDGASIAAYITRPKGNTVHLKNHWWYPVRKSDRRTAYGTNRCRASEWYAHYRFY